MREWIGPCSNCGNGVYCENGFFDGEQENGKLLCRSCSEELNDNDIREEKE